MPANRVILITEGDSDDAFFKKLLEVHGIQGCSIKQRNRGGISYFREQLRSLRTPAVRTKYNKILLIADNDSDPAAGFACVTTELREANSGESGENQFGIPNAPRVPATGSPSLPSVSILMLPWDGQPGCLETLCLRSTNQKYLKEKKCAEDLVECVSANNWAISQKSKLTLRCLLSSVCKSDPNTGLAYAWSTVNGRPGDIFPLDNPVFQPIATYLNQILV